MKKTILAFNLLLAVIAGAQTNSFTPAPLVPTTLAPGAVVTSDTPSTNLQLTSKGSLRPVGFVKNWLTDNKSFFGERTVILGLGGVYSHGRPTGSTAPAQDSFGGILTIGFPMDDNGQVTIGLWGAYWEHSPFYGSFSTTLGKTLTAPASWPVIGGEEIFIFNEGGPGFDSDGRMFAQDFVGGVYKHKIGANWQVYLTYAYGRVSIWDGEIHLFEAKVSRSF